MRFGSIAKLRRVFIAEEAEQARKKPPEAAFCGTAYTHSMHIQRLKVTLLFQKIEDPHERHGTGCNHRKNPDQRRNVNAMGPEAPSEQEVPKMKKKNERKDDNRKNEVSFSVQFHLSVLLSKLHCF